MLKLKFNTPHINREWNLQTALGMVDCWDGTLLYTSPEHIGAHQIVLGLNPIYDVHAGKNNNFALVDELIVQHHNFHFPFIFGHISYDAKHFFEETGVYKNLQDTNFPNFAFHVYQYVLIFDSQWQLTSAYEISSPQSNKNLLDIHQLKSFEVPCSKHFEVQYRDTSPAREEFEQNIKKIQEYIRAGDTYQVNITRKVTCNFSGSATDAAKTLLESNRIEFGVFYKSGGRYLISTSPERFFYVENNRIITSPIKGTAGRSESEEGVKEALLNDTKNLRELAMITDLMRNDLSRVCTPGSVKVKGYPILKTLANVYHLVADIEGILADQKFSKIIRAIFPGGSITGCPKIRACQIIEELEQNGRGPYTGTFGYITGSNKMDFNILIRTVFIDNNKLSFNVGGGITLLSDASDEWDETVHKARNIMNALNIAE